MPNCQLLPAPGTAPTLLGLGSNLGNREVIFQKALSILGVKGAPPFRISSLYDTDPVGFPGQANFLNAAIEIDWEGHPSDLLAICLDVEQTFGRIRGIPDGPRTLDLDILLVGSTILNTTSLQIPHPRLHLRRFVLAPLAEIAPDVVHPVLGRTIADLLESCGDPSGVRRLPDRMRLERSGPLRL